MVIGDRFWSRFIGVANLFPHYSYDPKKHKYTLEQNYDEADLYDVFNAIREKLNGGWTYTADFINKIDIEILEEDQRNARSLGVS